jgi:hypothetical protein
MEVFKTTDLTLGEKVKVSSKWGGFITDDNVGLSSYNECGDWSEVTLWVNGIGASNWCTIGNLKATFPEIAKRLQK